MKNRILYIHVYYIYIISSKYYKNKDAFLLGWGHHYNKSTIVITNWLMVTKHQFSNGNGCFCLLRRFVLSSITDKTTHGSDNKKHGGCLLRNRNCVVFVITWVQPRFFLILLVFCGVVSFVCLRSVSCV